MQDTLIDCKTGLMMSQLPAFDLHKPVKMKSLRRELSRELLICYVFMTIMEEEQEDALPSFQAKRK